MKSYKGSQTATIVVFMMVAFAASAGQLSMRLNHDITAGGRVGGSAMLGRISVQARRSMLAVADGWISPSKELKCSMWLTLDGRRLGSSAEFDWHGAARPVAHGFRVIAASDLSPGPHVLELHVSADAPVSVGSGTVLSALPDPATDVSMAKPEESVSLVQTNTRGGGGDRAALPHTDVVALSAGYQVAPVVTLAAGSVSYAGSGQRNFGDAFWVLFLSGEETKADEASVSDNDICRCAELTAPLAVQGFFQPDRVVGRVIGLGASAEPWPPVLGPDAVRYRVLPETALILLRGGMEVIGALRPKDTQGKTLDVRRFPYLCVGTSHATPGCPTIGESRVIASGDLVVPEYHTRPILMSAMTRVQGDTRDRGGRLTAWLELDGVPVGANVVQELSQASSVSTRTVTLSYLAESLAPGRHSVALVARAQGDFLHLSVTRNLPLIWFD